MPKRDSSDPEMKDENLAVTVETQWEEAMAFNTGQRAAAAEEVEEEDDEEGEGGAAGGVQPIVVRAGGRTIVLTRDLFQVRSSL